MLVKHNNNSISGITSAGQLAQGKMILISSQTASGSASIEFTSGIDSTYPIYKFEFINIHPATNQVYFQFNLSTDTGSTYSVTKTSSSFYAYHDEADPTTAVTYEVSYDLAQSTSDQFITVDIGNLNDESASGTMYLFNPSSTTFVKHFMSTSNSYYASDYSINTFIGGYGNTISPIDAVRFQMSSGNIDAGTIKLYGIKGD